MRRASIETKRTLRDADGTDLDAKRALTGAKRTLVDSNVVLGIVLGAGMFVVAIVSKGGVELGPNTWTEMALTVIGAALVAAAVLLGPPGSVVPGTVALALFLALVGLTFASISWSVQPDNSWVEANRTLSYLAAFAGAFALARLARERWPVTVGAVAVLATAICGYALLVKVFPATLDPGDTAGRVSAPFDYWNATGLIAALGLPACLWAGARRGAGRTLAALAVPAAGLMVTVLVLSYSRSALVVAIVGIAVWFSLVALRLRAALILALGAAGGAAASWWALGRHPFTHDNASLLSRTSAGHAFGLVLILVLGLLSVAGFLAARGMDRVMVPAKLRRRAGIVLVMLLALIPLGGLGALAGSSRGLTGEVSHEWSALTNTHSGAADVPGRLAELGNTRPRYWSEGLKVGEHRLAAGAGAGGYATARSRYTADPTGVPQAHSYVIETFADFGLIGVALSFALLAAWGLAAARAIGDTSEPAPVAEGQADERAAAPDRHPAERAGLLTLVVVVIVFGLDCAIDWTWFIPGAILPALVCAGWLAGRSAIAGRGSLAVRGLLALPSARGRARGPTHAPGTYAALVALFAVTILGVWTIWQPLRSASADADAITAFSDRSTGTAFRDARTAAARDPISVQPLSELSEFYEAVGNLRAARGELARATSVQPENSQTWENLGEFDLRQHAPKRALTELQVAGRLDLSSTTVPAEIAQASKELAAR